MNNSEGFVLEDIKLTRYSYPTKGTQPKVQYLLAKEGTYIRTERDVLARKAVSALGKKILPLKLLQMSK